MPRNKVHPFLLPTRGGQQENDAFFDVDEEDSEEEEVFMMQSKVEREEEEEVEEVDGEQFDRYIPGAVNHTLPPKEKEDKAVEEELEEVEEDDERYMWDGENASFSFLKSSNQPSLEKPSTRRNVEQLERVEQVESMDEDVEFMGIDDEADTIVGLQQGRLADPEMEAKVVKLAEMVQKLKEKNKTLKEKQLHLSELNVKLRAEVDKLEEEKEEAELKAERDLRMIQYKNSAGVAGGRNLQADLDAQRKRDEARRQLYSNEAEDDEVMLTRVDVGSKRGFAKRLVKKFNVWLRKHYPLNKDLKRIDARFGSSVAAYFHFDRWMITNYMAISVICLLFLVRHVLSLTTFQSLSAEEKALKYNSASEPLTYYDWDASDWGRLSTFVPKFLMPSSFNPGDTATIYFEDNISPEAAIYSPSGIAASTIPSSAPLELGERLDYIAMLIVCDFVLLVSTVIKWIREDRKAKAFGMFEELDAQSRFAQASLIAWDHSLTNPREAEDLKHGLLDQYFLMVHELETANLKKSRSLKERIILYFRRACSNAIYLCVQGSSAFAIVFLTAQSTQLSQQVLQAVEANASLQWLFPLVTLLSGSIVPIAVSIINAALPTIVTALTTFEKWDDAGFYTKLMLFRLFVAKIFNALIQIFSFLQLLDPYLLRGNPSTPLFTEDMDRSTRSNTEKRFVGVGSTYSATVPTGMDECRLDAFASGIFQLVATDFVISKLAFLLGPALKSGFSKLIKKPIVKPEFNVSKQMVDLLFFQQLAFLSFPFFPFGSLFIMAMMWCGFKLESFVLSVFLAKPKKPWSAKDAANFFIKFFFFTLAVKLAITFYILGNTFFPKACTLLEHITAQSFNASSGNPLETCFSTQLSAEDTCFLDPRNVGQVKGGTNRIPGLEELRFWEEYFVATKTSLSEGSSDTLVPTATLLREVTGYTSQVAVSDPTLFVCSLSCGPFVFTTNAYTPVNTLLSDNISVLYSLVTSSPLFIWSVTLLILLRTLFMKNTLHVMTDLQAEKEIALRNIVANMEAKIRKLSSKLDKMKQA